MRMPSYDAIVFGLRVAACGLGILAIAHLLRAGLFRRYRILWIFLCITVVRSLTLFATAWFPRPRNAYAWAWVVTEPIIWLAYVVLAVNLHSLALQNYKGLQTVGRWIFFTAIPITIVVSALTFLPDWHKPRGNITLFYYFVLARGIMFSLVVFILIILFLLSRYPISLSRNLVIHVVVCTTYLLSHSMGYLVRTVEGQTANHAMNIANEIITVLCWSAWLILLRPKGEEIKASVHRQFSADDEARLLRQLTAINSSLMRAAQK